MREEKRWTKDEGRGTMSAERDRTSKPRTVIVLEEQRTHIPLYKVLIHNDDVNTMEHVVGALMQVFKLERQACERIMIEAHDNGLALCTVEPFEKAEFHRDQLQSFSLFATIEPE
jgi:ATP-dependent Clp protease adaptor protein ClpS